LIAIHSDGYDMVLE